MCSIKIFVFVYVNVRRQQKTTRWRNERTMKTYQSSSSGLFPASVYPLAVQLELVNYSHKWLGPLTRPFVLPGAGCCPGQTWLKPRRLTGCLSSKDPPHSPSDWLTQWLCQASLVERWQLNTLSVKGATQKTRAPVLFLFPPPPLPYYFSLDENPSYGRRTLISEPLAEK